MGSSIIKYLFNSKLHIAALVVGVFLCILSFAHWDGVNKYPTFPVCSDLPTWILLGIGGALILLAFLLAWLEKRKQLGARSPFKSGISFKYEHTELIFEVKKINELNGVERHSAVVLPMNNSFVDTCIVDNRRATGAYFTHYYPSKIEAIKKDIKELLKKEPVGEQPNCYSMCTTLILPEKYNNPMRCIVTASALHSEGVALKTEPATIFKCIKKVFDLASKNRIEILYMPIIGSGRGGLDINDAIQCIVTAIKFYAKDHHTIKKVHVLVIPDDVQKITLDFSNFKTK